MSQILLVDDELDLMKMVAYQFRSRGHQVIQAGDGQEALEILKNQKPDLILLDLNMPNMGGIETYQQLCVGGAKPSYPVMILTARANTESLFKQFDIDGFMAKPFDVSVLIEEAEGIIKRHHRLHSRGNFSMLRSKKIFLVDDDPESFEKVSSVLLHAGYAVFPASSANQAIERVKLDMPDLVLAKLGLRDNAGDIVAASLRNAPETKNIPVIVYMPKGNKHDPAVMNNLREKKAVYTLVECADGLELVAVIDQFWAEK